MIFEFAFFQQLVIVIQLVQFLAHFVTETAPDNANAKQVSLVELVINVKGNMSAFRQLAAHVSLLITKVSS